MKTSELEQALAFQLRAEGITNYETEFRFCEHRKWRADIAFLPTETRGGVLIEVQGGIHGSGQNAGRHNRGAAMEREFVKLAEAQMLGWTVLQFGPKQVQDGTALNTIKRALEAV